MTPPVSARLAIVSTPIGNVDDLSRRAIEVLSDADLIFCEDTRHTGMLLSRAGVAHKRLMSLNAHNEKDRIPIALEALRTEQGVALVADAGTPLVSDPGAHLVAAVIDAGFLVVPIPGPSALLAALVVSGFDTSRFTFFGFLPRSGSARKKLLAAAADSTVAAVVYESPRRISETLQDLAALTGPERRIVIARELTKLFEEFWRGPIGEAIEHVRATEPIGEHVLVVEGRRADATDDAPIVRDALPRLVAAGLTSHDAAKAIEVLLGVPHRVAFEERLTFEAGLHKEESGVPGRHRKPDRTRTLR